MSVYVCYTLISISFNYALTFLFKLHLTTFSSIQLILYFIPPFTCSRFNSPLLGISIFAIDAEREFNLLQCEGLSKFVFKIRRVNWHFNFDNLSSLLTGLFQHRRQRSFEWSSYQCVTLALVGRHPRHQTICFYPWQLRHNLSLPSCQSWWTHQGSSRPHTVPHYKNWTRSNFTGIYLRLVCAVL